MTHGEPDEGTRKPSSWLSALSRVTSSGAYIPEVDGLRFIAIALVVLLHIHLYIANSDAGRYPVPPLIDGRGTSVPLRLIGEGQFGVELFFVISGFILALPFALHYFSGAPPVRLRAYLVRRLTRLEPPYLIAMLLLGLLTIATNRRGISGFAVIRSVAASSVYLHSIIFGTKSIVNFVTWSLEIEIQFYLLVPALTRLFAIRPRWLRRLAVIAIGLLFGASQHWGRFDSVPRLYLSVLNFAQYFLAGLFLADLYVDQWQSKPTQSVVWDFVSVIGWPAMFFAILIEPALVRWFLAPFIALLYVAVFRSIWVRRVFRSPVVTVIGGMCYSTYLLHVAVISAFGRLTLRVGPSSHYLLRLATQLPLLSVPILAVSAVFFLLVERPCMRRDWPQRLGRLMRETIGKRAGVS